MKILKIMLSVLLIGLFANASADALSDFNAKASAKVKKIVNDNKLVVVDFDYVNKAIGKGTRKTAKALVLDARPMKKYQISHIPSSRALPDTKFKKMYKDVLKGVPKDREIITFCGGFKCAKSPKLSLMLMKEGYTDVKVYAAGMPDWKKQSYGEMHIKIAKAMFDKNSATFVDARPNMKFKKGTITGAVNVPDNKFDKFKANLPTDKSKAVITFCGGFKCAKSHVVAKKLKAMGYKKVYVYAGGFPEWVKAKYPIGKAGSKMAKSKKSSSKLYLKKGADTGSVDGEWFVKNYTSFPKSVTLVNVMDAEEFAAGHIPGSINVNAEAMEPKELLAKLPKKGEIVFYCGTGTRAMEAWGMLAEDLKYNRIYRVMYLDGNVECSKDNKCTIEANEPLGV